MGPEFTAEEYEARLARVRTGMADRGLDALIVTDPANMNWLTGYDGWSFYSHQAVLVLPDRAPLWWGRELDVAGARLTSRLPHDHVVGFPEELVQSRDRHPFRHLAGLLADIGLGRGRIGVEADAPYFTAAAQTALTASLPDADLTDCTGLVNRARAIKSEAEIGLMRTAGRVTTSMFSTVAELLEPGLPRHELVAEVQRVATLGADGLAGDYPAIVPLLPGGREGAAPHVTWDERPFAASETYFFEMSGCVRRYHAPMSRSFTLGEATAEMRSVEEACLAGLEAGLDRARPGRRAGEVADAVFTAMARHGVERGGRCGYPVGVGYPPDWGERTMSLRHGDDTVLESGMTIHLMPVRWSADAPIGITETIVVVPRGPAVSLVDHPRRLMAL